jgi:hypothetical protein
LMRRTAGPNRFDESLFAERFAYLLAPSLGAERRSPLPDDRGEGLCWCNAA